MGFAGRIPTPGQVAPPTTPIAAASYPEELKGSIAFANQGDGTTSANPQGSSASRASKAAGGAFSGFTPATTSPSLQMPMTANKTLTGQ